MMKELWMEYRKNWNLEHFKARNKATGGSIYTLFAVCLNPAFFIWNHTDSNRLSELLRCFAFVLPVIFIYISIFLHPIRRDKMFYLCPMDREEDERFYNELINAESAPLKEHDKEHFAKDGFKVYEGCMPVEVLAKRGEDTLRFGPLKPVGLRDPRTDKRPWAVVQLRAENTAGSMYNLVGFQTNLKFGEQKRVFSLIPGLENAEFMRYGVMHRNTFINSPKLLNEQFNMRERPSLYFAGQMTGVEGYIESAASGIFAGLNMARQIQGLSPVSLPETTMLGSLSKYISSPDTENFQPMGCNMGILPEWGERIKDKKLKYKLLAERGLADLDKCIAEL